MRAPVVGALALSLAALVAACRTSDQSASPATSASGATTATTAPSRVACDGDNEHGEDDDDATVGLLGRTQYPSGEWLAAPAAPCSWALSTDELLVTPACLDAASAAGAPANDEARNGNAHIRIARADGVQLDDRVEIYTSRQNVDALRAVLAGPARAPCFDSALLRRTQPSGANITDVHVSPTPAPLDAAALDVGFPAAAGFAADPGFIDGTDISFRAGPDGPPVAMRVLTFGSGGGVSTITVVGGSRADLDAVDLTETLRAAGANYRKMFSPG
jgi:hypothetical protein